MGESVGPSPVAGWDRLWRVLVYAVLAAPTTVAMLRPDEPASQRLLLLGVSVLVAAWHWWMVTAHPHWPERRTAPMVLYFVGLLGPAWFLYSQDPIYFLLLLGCYPTAFATLPGALAYAGAAATSAVAAAATALAGEGAVSAEWALASLGGFVLACVIGGALRALEAERDRRGRAYSELSAAHVRLAGLAEQNAGLQEQLVSRARESGVLAERARMARELHDTLAQGLAGVLSQLRAADTHVSPEHPAREYVDRAQETAKETLADARRSMLALRPVPLDAGTLPAAVESVVESWREHEGPRAEVAFNGDPVRLAADTENALLRAAQEALANVARHARATRVAVTLTFMDDVVVLDVRDDGVGFDPGTAPGPAADGSGFGLTAMRHRIARVAGEVTIESGAGRGTALSIVVPAARREGEAGT